MTTWNWLITRVSSGFGSQALTTTVGVLTVVVRACIAGLQAQAGLAASADFPPGQ